MTRYFEVKVTGCCECACRSGDRCYHYSMNLKSNYLCEKVYAENKDKLTDSCPMWNETKESETK